VCRAETLREEPKGELSWLGRIRRRRQKPANCATATGDGRRDGKSVGWPSVYGDENAEESRMRNKLVDREKGGSGMLINRELRLGATAQKNGSFPRPVMSQLLNEVAPAMTGPPHADAALRSRFSTKLSALATIGLARRLSAPPPLAIGFRAVGLRSFDTLVASVGIGSGPGSKPSSACPHSKFPDLDVWKFCKTPDDVL